MNVFLRILYGLIAAGIVLAAIGVLAFKRYLYVQASEFLYDLASESDAGVLSYDSLDISLLTMSGSARNVRLKRDGQEELWIERVVVPVNIEKIRDRELILETILLESPTINGFGQDSAAYKLADYFSRDKKPGDKEPAIRAIFSKLRVRNASVAENLDGADVRANGVDVVLRRTGTHDLELIPSIAELHIAQEGAATDSHLVLKDIKTRVLIAGKKVHLPELKLALKNAWIELGAVLDHENVQASAKYGFDAKDLGLEELLDVKVVGRAELGGTLDAPTVSGQMESEGGLRVKLGSEAGPLRFDEFSAGFTARRENKVFEAELSALEMQGQASKIVLKEPIRLEGRKISGSVGIESKSVSYKSVHMQGGRFVLSLDGTINKPRFSLIGSASSVDVSGYSFGPADVKVSHQGSRTEARIESSSSQGELSAEAVVKSAAGETLTLEKCDFQIKSLPLSLLDGMGKDGGQGLGQLSASGTLSGPLELSKLEGRGKLLVELPIGVSSLSLGGEMAFSKGKIRADLKDDDAQISLSGLYDVVGLSDSSLEMRVLGLSPADYWENVPCEVISGEVSYSFPGTRWKEGQGKVVLKELTLGVAPNALSLSDQYELVIQNRSLHLKGLKLANSYSSFSISGIISYDSGYALDTGGTIELKGFLPSEVFGEDAEGKLKAALSLSGPLRAPVFSGELALENSSLSFEGAGFELSDLEGRAKIDGNLVAVEALSGAVNNGTCTARGEFDLFELSRVNSTLECEGLEMHPLEGAVFELSGKLALDGSYPKGLKLSGEIVLERGEVVKKIDPQYLAGLLLDYLLKRDVKSAPAALANTFSLDVRLVGNGNILVKSNLLEAELAVDIRAQGSSAAPKLSGHVDSLTGRAHISGHSFDIISGSLVLDPLVAQPMLEVYAETTQETPAYGTVLVLVELSGPLTSPQVIFTADQDLSQTQILRLLSGSTGSSKEQLGGLLFEEAQSELLDLMGDESHTSAIGLIKRAVTLDELSASPSMNTDTGEIDLAVIAAKDLTDKIRLSSESTLGAYSRAASFRLAYQLTPALSAGTVLNAPLAERPTSGGVDVIYTSNFEKPEQLAVHLKGEPGFSKEEILGALRISSAFRLRRQRLESLRKSLEDFYKDRGFLAAKTDLLCAGDDEYCRELIIEAYAGLQSVIEEVRVKGDALTQLLEPDKLEVPAAGTPATREVLRKTCDRITRKLRERGFLAARLNCRYEETVGEGAGGRALDINVRSGKRIEFILSGNKRFSTKELFDEQNLLGRRQAFSQGAVYILIRNIKEKYQNSGYYYIKAESSREYDEMAGIVRYRIGIDEGPSVSINSVELEGNSSVSRSVLEAMLREHRRFDAVFRPKAVVDMDLQANSRLFEAIYRELGFEDTKASHEVIPLSDTNKVDVRYTLDEGQRRVLDALRVEDVPAGISLPPVPTEPITLLSAGRYTELARRALFEKGFHLAQAVLDIDAERNEAVLSLKLGERSTINRVEISGADNVKENVIREHLGIGAGADWDNSLLSTARRRLLRLGLFSRVETLPVDGVLDGPKEDLLVRVTERELQTFSGGLGFDSEYGIHLPLSGSDRSLFGDGRMLGANLDMYYDPVSRALSKGMAGLKFFDPSFLATPFGLTENLRYQRLDTPNQDFDLDRLALSSYISRTLPQGLYYSLGHTFSLEDPNDVAEDIVLSELDNRGFNLSMIAARIGYDQRTDPLYSMDGYRITLEGKVASGILGSQADLAGLSADFAVFKRLPVFDEKLGVALHLRTASSWPFSDTSEIPISQRYFVGGRDSVRGFRENSLGPRGADGGIIGGDLLAVGNFELRYLLSNRFVVHVFTDAGNVYLQRDAVGALRYSAGFGLRYLSPVGPLGLDIGFPLNEKPGEPSSRLHFVVGMSF